MAKTRKFAPGLGPDRMYCPDGVTTIAVEDFSRYLTIRGVAGQVQGEAHDLQSAGVPIPNDVWEGIIETLENIRTCLAGLTEG